MLECKKHQHQRTARETAKPQEMHNLSIIAILEPFADNSHINNYILLLNMDNAHSNQNGDDQRITCELKHVELSENFLITFIYANYREYLRRPLRDRLLYFSNISNP